jgi:hypothetical protein
MRAKTAHALLTKSSEELGRLSGRAAETSPSQRPNHQSDPRRCALPICRETDYNHNMCET